MVKGVNKNIIEVHDLNSTYFEKAILFVKPEYALFDSEKLFREAKRYVNNADLNRKCGKKPRPSAKSNILGKFVCGAGAAMITAFACYFIF